MENIHAMDHAVFKKEMGSKVGFVLILLPSFFFFQSRSWLQALLKLYEGLDENISRLTTKDVVQVDLIFCYYVFLQFLFSK